MDIQKTSHQKLKELFHKIEQITEVRDIGYHEIFNGRLNPVYKTNTDILGIEKWKSVHDQNPVFIEQTEILKELVTSKKPVVVQDVNNDSRSASAFFLFGIDSIAVIPVVENNSATGIVCIASIGTLHSFSEDEIEKCTNFVKTCFEK